ncbi:MAG: DUF5752 family protein [Candidatus Woesearchaeota archaeon]
MAGKKSVSKKSKVSDNKSSGSGAAEKSLNETRIEVTVEKKIPGEVPEKYHFYLNDGRRLKDLYELIDALDSMSDEVFKYHVNESKNDFSNWIKEVMDDQTLAEDLKEVESKVEAQLKLLKHIVRKIRN